MKILKTKIHDFLFKNPISLLVAVSTCFCLTLKQILLNMICKIQVFLFDKDIKGKLCRKTILTPKKEENVTEFRFVRYSRLPFSCTINNICCTSLFSHPNNIFCATTSVYATVNYKDV